VKSKEQHLEDWAVENKIELTPDLYLLNQRSEILSQLEMVGVTVELPAMLLESLNSAQFAEVVAGAVGRKVKHVK
jgi:hypothetical protein